MKAKYALEEISGKVVGPMPPLEFIDAFLPAPTQGHDQRPHDLSTIATFLKAKASEKHQSWVCGTSIGITTIAHFHFVSLGGRLETLLWSNHHSGRHPPITRLQRKWEIVRTTSLCIP